MLTLTVNRIVGVPPFVVLPGHAVFNAPRPLYGAERQGPFVHGVFYGVVDLSDRYADDFVKRNVELDGWLCSFVPEAEVTGAWFDAYCDAFPECRDVDFEKLNVLDIYCYYNGRREIKVDMPLPWATLIEAVLAEEQMVRARFEAR